MLMKNLAAIARYGHAYAHHDLRGIRVSGSEHAIIMYLASRACVNQEAIAEFLMLDKGSVARALLKLEGKNLVARTVNPENRREKIVSLTEHGQAIVAEVVNTALAWESELLEGLSPQERELFYRLSEKIAALKAEDAAKGGSHE